MRAVALIWIAFAYPFVVFGIVWVMDWAVSGDAALRPVLAGPVGDPSPSVSALSRGITIAGGNSSG
jgi:hypothetical protein